jgi:hypothetical protein
LLNRVAMTTRKAAVFAALLLIGACGGAGPDDLGDGDDKEDGAGRCANPAPTIDGNWEIDSAFDIVLPTGAAGPLWQSRTAFDGAADPFEFLWQHAIDAIPPGEVDPYRSILRGAATLILPQLQRQIPDRYAKLGRFGRDANSLMRRFGLRARLEVGARRASCDYPAKLVVHSLTYVAEGRTAATVIPFGSLGQPEVVVESLDVSVDFRDQTVRLGSHALPLAYGPLMEAALEQVVLPAIDPGVADGTPMAGYLAAWIPCSGKPSLGTMAADALPVPGDLREELLALAEAHCPVALQAGADAITASLSAATLSFDLNGLGKVVDTNADGIADEISGGHWEGTVKLDGEDRPLVTPPPFVGRR